MVLKPANVAIPGTKAIRLRLLAGAVRKPLGSREVAISNQAGEAQVAFLEDAGLAKVVPVEMVDDTATENVSVERSANTC